ncbi:STM3941 family protein [Flavobacterium subsaxonicum]|uniref:Uncharacterized protein n=1 Tax=Flavobacterium subsaxonicum WB 4.1-42 = DSM 21790 TaxID=1121898 RepID=A0A0A2MNB9_9FLAO|nr:STM3941 family protein [Flavobacterium subsaxonicum]KGO92973.1 hypothetical protein Q766_10130 [Flavobacterium subsaxonicum WB 4.1-42 = DSM 21790]
MDVVIIKPNKFDVISLFIVALLFVAGSVWLLFIANEQSPLNAISMKILTMVVFLLFGAALIYSAKKLRNNKPAIIINDKGILNNYSTISGGFVAWKEITDIKMIQVRGACFIMIYTVNPEKYMKDKNLFKKKMILLNLKKFGTTLIITGSNIKYNFDELEKLLQSRLNQYKLENQ